MIMDVRYSLVPNELKPLWVIQLKPEEPWATCRLSEHPGSDSREPPAVSGNADLAGHNKPTGQVFINGVANKQSDFISF